MESMKYKRLVGDESGVWKMEEGIHSFTMKEGAGSGAYRSLSQRENIQDGISSFLCLCSYLKDFRKRFYSQVSITFGVVIHETENNSLYIFTVGASQQNAHPKIVDI